jgi:hypothetical protein
MLSSFSPRPTWTFSIEPALAITTASLPDATLGADYSATLTATAGVSPYFWSLSSGSLPTGLTLSPSGNIAGRAVVPGTATFTVEVTDSESPTMTATAVLSITVDGCGTTVTGTHSGPLRIGAGVTCISGATISGPVSISAGAVVAVSASELSGPLSANGAAQLSVCSSHIAGSLSVTNSSGFVLVGDAGNDGSPACNANVIWGRVNLTNNSGGVQLGGNSIAGSVSLTGNTGLAVQIEANNIAGPLGCSGNLPAPTDQGQFNIVKGGASGQCATLV